MRLAIKQRTLAALRGARLSKPLLDWKINGTVQPCDHRYTCICDVNAILSVEGTKPLRRL